MSKAKYEPLESSRFKDLPGPLFTLLSLYDLEENWFRKVHRLIDNLEWAIKWHTVLIMSDMLREAVLSAKMKLLLSSGLRTPSLGIWNLFFRESMGAVKTPLVPWDDWERLVELEKKHQMVSFRNRYAHGATPADEDCKKDCERFYPVLLQLIGSQMFTDIGLLVSGPEGVFHLQGDNRKILEIELALGHASALLPSKDVLDLWPLGLYSTDPKVAKNWNFFYFNALKGPKIEQLNYEQAIIFRDKELWEPFHERLPLKEWAKEDIRESGGLFQSIIDEKIHGFVGRKSDIESIQNWIQGKSCGFFVIQGDPGIGKSALMATIARQDFLNIEHYSWQGIDKKENQNFLEIVKKKWREIDDNVKKEFLQIDKQEWVGLDKQVWMGIDVIPYFIVRGETTGPGEFLKAILQMLSQIINLKYSPAGNEGELAEELRTQLRVVSQKLVHENRKLLLVIDGLDEALSAKGDAETGRNLLDYIPHDVPSRVFILMAGRRKDEIDTLYDTIHREKRGRLLIDGLTNDDIRGMLYKVVSKYELKDKYIERVHKLSEGNPLYVKLLMEELIEGRMSVNDIGVLPQSLEDMYRKIVDRLGGSSQEIIDVLMTFALARERLTAGQVAGINKLSLARTREILRNCLEVLTEGQNAAGRTTYRVFHDSFSDYVKKHPDYGAIRPQIELRFLTYAASQDQGATLEPEISGIIQTLMGGGRLMVDQTAHLSSIIKRASGMLTSFNIVFQKLQMRSLDDIGEVLTALARITEPSTAHLVKQCLIASAKGFVEPVARIIKDLTGRSSGKKRGCRR